MGNYEKRSEEIVIGVWGDMKKGEAKRRWGERGKRMMGRLKRNELYPFRWCTPCHCSTPPVEGR
jgi:hypothetical protein